MKDWLMCSGRDLGSKLCNREGYLCQHLSFILCGKTTEGKSRSKPDSGNLAVRNCRGGLWKHAAWSDNHLPRSRKRRIPGKLIGPKTGVRHISISTNPLPNVCCCRYHYENTAGRNIPATVFDTISHRFGNRKTWGTGFKPHPAA